MFLLDGDCIHMTKKSEDIKGWEMAFQSLLVDESDSIALTLDNWGDILRNVSDELWLEYGEDDSGLNAPWEFSNSANAFKLGQISLNYPNSLHGDGCTVPLYKLPSGICVAIRYASFEIEEPNSILFGRKLSVEQVLDVSREMLFECGEIDEYQNLDESPDLEPDTRVAYSGELEVRSHWRLTDNL